MKNFIKSRDGMWTLIAFIATFSVIFFIVVGFVYPGWAVEKGYIDEDGDLITKRAQWVQHLMNFLYFTFLSNFLVMTISYFRVFKRESKMINTLLIIAATSITMTMLVYWTVLFYPENLNTVEMINTVLVHLVVPVSFLIGFAVDIKNKEYTVKLPTKETLLTILVFPIVWLIMSLILYTSLGGEVDHAIYGFLHYNGLGPLLYIIFITGISLSFIIFSYAFLKIYSLSAK